MPPPLTETEFASFVKRAGLTCTAAELAEYYEAYGYVVTMAERLRRPRSHMAEPATCYAHPQEVPA